MLLNQITLSLRLGICHWTCLWSLGFRTASCRRKLVLVLRCLNVPRLHNVERSWESLWAGRDVVRTGTWGAGRRAWERSHLSRGGEGQGPLLPAGSSSGTKNSPFLPRPYQTLRPLVSLQGHSEVPGRFPGVCGVAPNVKHWLQVLFCLLVLTHNSFPFNLPLNVLRRREPRPRAA